MRALITGIAGFAGSHLADFMLQQGAEVFGSIRRRALAGRLDAIKRHIRLIDCDLRDLGAVQALIATSRPDCVFHLEAETWPSRSLAPHLAAVGTNVTCQINLLETIRAFKPDTSVHIAGSFEEYGLVFEEECPITESNPLRPLSPSGVSQVAQDLLGYQYFMAYGLRIVRTRAFDHLGPRQNDDTLGSTLARQIAEIEFGRRPAVITMPSADVRREFIDVRDVVRAYWLALRQAVSGEVYNVAVGHAYSIRQFVQKLLAVALMPPDLPIVSQAGDRMGPLEVPLLVGDGERLRTATGWEPLVPLDQTCADLLDYWRIRIKQRTA